MNFKKVARAFGAGVVLILAGVTSSYAAVDASVAGAMTTIQTDAATLAGDVTPVVVAILGLVIGIKLIKRFGNKI